MIRQLFFATTCALFLAACSSSEQTGATHTIGTTVNATFVDAPVAGLNYSGPSYSGVTSATGSFLCKLGEIVTFKLGDLLLGRAPCSNAVFPMHLTGETAISSSGGAVAMGVLFKLLDTTAGDSVFTIPANVRKMNFSTAFDFSTFDAVSDLNTYTTLIDEINADAGLMIDSIAVQTDYTVTHAPAAVTELQGSLTNPSYVSLPANMASFAGKYFYIIGQPKAGNPSACAAAGPLYAGVGFASATLGSGKAYQATLYAGTDFGITDNTPLAKTLVTSEQLGLSTYGSDPDEYAHLELYLPGNTLKFTGTGKYVIGKVTCSYKLSSIETTEPGPPQIPGALLTISDANTYDYGSVFVGTSQDQTFTVTNVGGGSATAMNGLGLSGPFSYKGGSYPGTGGTCASVLAMGSTCTITVSFTPVTPGLHTDAIQMNYSDGTSMMSSFRDVQGTGVTPAILVINDGPVYDFGTISTSTSANHTFTVSNIGGLTAVSIAGGGLAAPYAFAGGVYPGVGGTCGASLPAGASCTIVVRFSPTSTGAQNDTLEVNYNDGGFPQSTSRGLTGTGL